jgi:uncharacterized protein with von Willebrand factor type A (vWA) domain
MMSENKNNSTSENKNVTINKFCNYTRDKNKKCKKRITENAIFVNDRFFCNKHGRVLQKENEQNQQNEKNEKNEQNVSEQNVSEQNESVQNHMEILNNFFSMNNPATLTMLSNSPLQYNEAKTKVIQDITSQLQYIEKIPNFRDAEIFEIITRIDTKVNSIMDKLDIYLDKTDKLIDKTERLINILEK